MRTAIKIEFRNLKDHMDEAVRIFVSAYAQPPWTEEWSSDFARLRLDELLVHPKCLAVAGFNQDRLAGFAVGTPHTGASGTSLYVGELVVDPAVQRQGVGRALLSRLEKNAVQSGYESMWLVTERISTTTDFYSKSGFKGSDRLTVLARRFSHTRR
jgi:GNAT superfamily N-acetyltransferase